MKKLFNFLFALAAMLLTNTSCSDDLENSVTSDNEATVSFKVQLESAVNSRAVGDGTTAKELLYEVYKVNGTGIGDRIESMSGSTTVSGLNATVTFTLVKGQTYNFLFWAQNEDGESYYTLNKDAGTITVKYGTDANDEKRDAFFKVRKDLKVTGPINETIVLKRPFAQVNVGTTIGSLAAAAKAEVNIDKSLFIVKDAATTLNAYTGAATNKQMASFTLADIIESNKADNVGDLKNVDSKDYEYLAMNYILVADETDANKNDAYGVGENKQLINATFQINDGTNVINTFEIPNVPVQRNFRTNIIGEIMNANVTFNVVVDPNFDGEHNYNTNEELAYVLKNGGTYTLTGNETVEETLVVNADAAATLNLNGYTLTIKHTETAEYGIDNQGTLTINGGNIVDENSTGAAIFNFTGTVNLNDVNITAKNGNTIRTDGNETVLVPNRADGAPYTATVNIKGGTYISEAPVAQNRAAIYAIQYSKLVINDATFKANHTAISMGSCEADLSGVTAISTNYYGLYMNCSWVEYTDDCVFVGKDNKDIYVEDLNNPAWTSFINEVEYKTSGAINTTVDTANELSEAIAKGGVIALNADVALNAALTVSNDVTLNLNGKTLTGQIANKGTLKLLNGNVTYNVGGTYKKEAAITNEGILELDNVNLTSDVFCIRATGSWAKGKTLQEQGEVTVKTIINGGTIKSTATAHDTEGRHIYAIYGLDNSLLSVDGATIEGDGGIAINCANVDLKNTTVNAKCSNNCAYCLYMEGAANATVAESCTLTSTSVKVYAYDKWENKYGTIVYNGEEKLTGVVVK